MDMDEWEVVSIEENPGSTDSQEDDQDGTSSGSSVHRGQGESYLTSSPSLGDDAGDQSEGTE